MDLWQHTNFRPGRNSYWYPGLWSVAQWYRQEAHHKNGKGIPRDFPTGTLLPRFSCLVCPLGKGERQYKHTAAFRVNLKAAGSSTTPKHQPERGVFAVRGPDSSTQTAPDPDELTVNVGDAMPGETLQAIQEGKVDISIDLAHAAALATGQQKEKYYW